MPALVNAPEDPGVHGPRLYVTADPLSTPLQNWTKVDLARHHDESAAGQWWAGKWQFFATSSGAPPVPGLCAGGTADGELQFPLVALRAKPPAQADWITPLGQVGRYARPRAWLEWWRQARARCSCATTSATARLSRRAPGFGAWM